MNRDFGLGIAAASFFASLIVLFRRNFQQKRYSGKPDPQFRSEVQRREGTAGKLLIFIRL